jgi:hypothetical protein
VEEGRVLRGNLEGKLVMLSWNSRLLRAFRIQESFVLLRDDRI